MAFISTRLYTNPVIVSRQTKTLIGLVITRVASRHKESSRLRLRKKRIHGVPGKKAHHLRPEDIAKKYKGVILLRDITIYVNVVYKQ